jgi:hypothetical protein
MMAGGGADAIISAMVAAVRKPLRELPAIAIKFQYLIYPYANFHVGPLGKAGYFKIGPFDLWRDEEANWLKFLGVFRPASHLAMYVDRDGNSLDTIWIATLDKGASASVERWQHLTAVLFYLAWARIPYSSPDRPSAEDLYYEVFSSPEGSDPDAASHTRWSKYASNFWSALKIHPDPNVSLNGTHITLPIQIPVSPIFDFDRESSDLFLASEAQLQKPDSGLLTALWFLYQSTFRSPSRSSFTEDIQNICTALEALVKTTKKGDTGNQVCEALVRIFTPQAADAADAWAKRSPSPERTEVLQELEAWVRKLYEIRNAYTHGRTTFDFFFHGRSIWQDAFDIFRTAANRVILGRPEPRCLDGSRLEKRLMSVRYFDAAVSVLADKQRWMAGGKYLTITPELDEVIRMGETFDPGLVESITSLKNLRQALFNICMTAWACIENATASTIDGKDRDELLNYFRESYRECLTPKISADAFIRRIAPGMSMWVPGLAVPNTNRRIFELLKVFKNLAFVYGQATTPILNRLVDMTQ